MPLTLANAPDDTEVAGGGDGRPGHRPHRPAVRRRPAVGGHRHHGGRGPHLGVRRHRRGRARAKGELVEAVPVDGFVVLNGQRRHGCADGRAHRRPGAHLRRPRATWCAQKVDVDERPPPPVPPRVTVGDASTCSWPCTASTRSATPWPPPAAALAQGVPLDAVAAGLGDAELSPWRMELRRTAAGAVVINDAYNANPTALAAALHSLAALDADRHVAVLGLMAELGAAQRRPPRRDGRAGRRARHRGDHASAARTTAWASTWPTSTPPWPRSASSDAGDAVLVKASRVGRPRARRPPPRRRLTDPL